MLSRMVLSLSSLAIPMVSSVCTWIALGFLIFMAVCDGKYGRVHDGLTFSFIVCAMAVSMLRGSLAWEPALLGGGFFGVQWIVSRGRAVGTADILTGIGMGFLLGSWKHLLIALGLAYSIGASVVMVVLLNRSITLKSRIALIPFLATGTIVDILFR